MNTITKIVSVCGLGLTVVACSAAQQNAVSSAISPVAACIADVVLSTSGTESPTAIAAQCGAAVSDVEAVIATLLSSQPTTTTTTTTPPTAAELGMRTHLNNILINGKAK
jgi:hypothetical protein